MAITKVERLMNLVIALLSTSQFLTADKIRAGVAGYDESPTADSFSRMFERDKTELRELGIPLETGQARFGGGEGYRINRDAYELPEIELSSEESAAVAVAVQLWESPELTAAAHSALLKLRAGGVVTDQDPPVAITAVPSRSRGSEPALRALLSAIDAGRRVRFEHRSAPNMAPKKREVEPWGVVTDRGRWYLVGYDLARDAARTFRLSRIGDDVEAYGPENVVAKPDGLNLRQYIDQFVAQTPVTGTATVWLAEGHGQDIRRLGTVVGARRVGDRDGALVEIEIRSRDWLSRLVAGHGPDALLIEPTDVRDAVLARLRAVGSESTDRGSPSDQVVVTESGATS